VTTRSSDLEEGFVGEADCGEAASVDCTGVDADAEGFVPANREVDRGRVAVDDGDTELVRQVGAGALPEEILGAGVA